eukprot:3913163-Pyramimonas_sp.AAC.1
MPKRNHAAPFADNIAKTRTDERYATEASPAAEVNGVGLLTVCSTVGLAGRVAAVGAAVVVAVGSGEAVGELVGEAVGEAVGLPVGLKAAGRESPCSISTPW